MSLRTELRTLRATLEGLRSRRSYPLLVLPGGSTSVHAELQRLRTRAV